LGADYARSEKKNTAGMQNMPQLNPLRPEHAQKKKTEE
jgi:hypothetical protein